MDLEKSLFKKLDCLRIYVPDLNKGLKYYHEYLGLKIKWKTEREIGLLMEDGIGELVIQDKDKREETDIKVDSVLEAIPIIEKAGGKVIHGPFDIKIGKCAVVEDPWNNKMVILDSTKGTFVTDDDGNILGQGNS